ALQPYCCRNIRTKCIATLSPPSSGRSRLCCGSSSRALHRRRGTPQSHRPRPLAPSESSNDGTVGERTAPQAIPLNISVGHENVSFFCPIFLGHAEARASASKASGCFMGGTQWCKGGTGKAEAAKPQVAGISLKQCPEK